MNKRKIKKKNKKNDLNKVNSLDQTTKFSKEDQDDDQKRIDHITKLLEEAEKQSELKLFVPKEK